jgi:hypothetical protein
MRRLVILTLAFMYMVWPLPMQARDFTLEDFDPADPAQAEAYQSAIGGLLDELAVIASDDEGNELFRVVPYPLELVILTTQAAIHERNITDSREFEAVVMQANADKPTSNSFAFVLDGDPQWVRREVEIRYFPEEEGPGSSRVPAVRVSREIADDGAMVAVWVLMARDADELEAFLAAPRVELRVGDEETDDAIVLDCGFWRQWMLFDLTEWEEDSTNPPASQ